MTQAIETNELTKVFGDTEALNGVNLSIRKGSVYGILGPNGAGKTTTIRILTTLLKPSGGKAMVLGHDVLQEASVVRRKVSLTGQYASVDDDLNGDENLVLVGRLLGLSWAEARKRAIELLDSFALSEAAGRQVRTFSGGMRRRLDIAASLVTKPEILFLDEPTTGLDPRSRNQVWDLVRQIAGEGTTVLLTTQYLEEADRLAERLAVIDHGKVIAEGTSRDLKSSVGGNTLNLRLVNQAQTPEAQGIITRFVGEAASSMAEPGAFAVKVSHAAAAAELVSALSQAQVQVLDMSLGAPSLDDVFFALTGRPAEDKANDNVKGAKA